MSQIYGHFPKAPSPPPASTTALSNFFKKPGTRVNWQKNAWITLFWETFLFKDKFINLCHFYNNSFDFAWTDMMLTKGLI